LYVAFPYHHYILFWVTFNPYLQSKIFLTDKVALIVIDRYVARNILVKKFPWHLDKIEFMHLPLFNKKLYLAISKKTGNPDKKMHDFNAGLSILIEDGILDNLKHQYGF